jgi:predicted nucleic acid-binding protein
VRYAVDSNVIIAALLSWHEHHHAAHEMLSVALSENNELVVPLQSLIESYSVMTRLPPPHRVSSEDAVGALKGTFKRRARITSLDSRNVWTWLAQIASDRITGGRVYDGLIATSAINAGATHILTLNRRHFELFGEDLQVVSTSG